MCENLIWILSCVFGIMAWFLKILSSENKKLLKELRETLIELIEAKKSNKELLEANYKLCKTNNINFTYKIVK